MANNRQPPPTPAAPSLSSEQSAILQAVLAHRAAHPPRDARRKDRFTAYYPVARVLIKQHQLTPFEAAQRLIATQKDLAKVKLRTLDQALRRHLSEAKPSEARRAKAGPTRPRSQHPAAA